MSSRSSVPQPVWSSSEEDESHDQRDNERQGFERGQTQGPPARPQLSPQPQADIAAAATGLPFFGANLDVAGAAQRTTVVLRKAVGRSSSPKPVAVLVRNADGQNGALFQRRMQALKGVMRKSGGKAASARCTHTHTNSASVTRV